jgi:hypothetical protein
LTTEALDPGRPEPLAAGVGGLEALERGDDDGDVLDRILTCLESIEQRLDTIESRLDVRATARADEEARRAR